MKPAIQVNNLSKQFVKGERQLYYSLRDTLAELIKSPTRKIGKTKNNDQKFWALKDLNFKIMPGEVVGVIGKNGAGKSTLLKVLSGITPPTEGVATLKGRVGSLLEVGTGFHQELTGEENIYLYGAILGMSKSEVKNKFDKIVGFSEVEEFIGTPLKHYSSGMRTRLAFSVAAFLEPEIMFIDEVLSVGDSKFQKKALGRINKVSKSGRTILFVSHNMASISHLCSKTIYLENGKIKFFGDTKTAIQKYLSSFSRRRRKKLIEYKKRTGQGNVLVSDLKFIDPDTGNELTHLLTGQPVDIEIELQSEVKKLNTVKIDLSIYAQNGQFITSLNSKIADSKFSNLNSQKNIICHVPKLPFLKGNYYMDITLASEKALQDKLTSAVEFVVEQGDYFNTGNTYDFKKPGVYINHKWGTIDG